MLIMNKNRLISFLAALCLFLSAIEYAIPKPLPFLRLGLANLPILISLYLLTPKETLFLSILKILGQGFISGTFFSYIFVFSAGGSLASSITMIAIFYLFKKGTYISNIGLSLAGALANNAVQLLLSYFILFGENTKYIAPILLISACITGCALGIFTNLFVTKSIWFQKVKNEIA